MSGQTTYQDQLRGFAGQRVGSGHDAKTGVNDTGAVRQVDDIRLINVPTAQVHTVSVDGDESDGDYTVTINGVDFTFAASSSTATEIRDGLVTLINAGAEPVTAAPVSTEDMTLTADVDGVPFTIAIVSPSADMSLAATTANVGEGTTFTFTVDVGGGAVSVAYTGAVGELTAAPLRDGLLAAARGTAEFEGILSFNPSSTDTVRITALVQGVAFTSAESDANLTRTLVTANVAPAAIPFGRGVAWRPGSSSPDSIQLPSEAGQVFQGVLERIHTVVDPDSADSDPAGLSPFQAGTVIQRGQVLVELEAVTVDPSSGVFVRHTSGGGGTVLGRFRDDADTASADEITTAKWADVFTGPGLAVLSLDSA